jgi:hypothetical protein
MSDKDIKEREENLVRIFLSNSRLPEPSLNEHIRNLLRAIKAWRYTQTHPHFNYQPRVPPHLLEPQVVDHAEQIILALADKRARQSFSHVKPVADQILEEHFSTLWKAQSSGDWVVRDSTDPFSPWWLYVARKSQESEEEKGESAVFDIFFAACMTEMEDTLRRMQRDQEDIERLKNETRNILSKLQAA